MQSAKIVFAVSIFLLAGITSVPLAKAGATTDTAVVHFSETRSGLTCLDPAGAGTGAFFVVLMVHFTEDPQGRFHRVSTATEEFTYVTFDGVTFSGHQAFHSTVIWEPDGGIVAPLLRVVVFSGQANGSDGSLTVWSGLSVSVDDTVFQDRFECGSF